MSDHAIFMGSSRAITFMVSPSTGSGQHILGLQLGDLIGVKLE
jgi:hypothetical protein